MLDNGAAFPAVEARDLEGNVVSLDTITTGSWSIVLFYRGHW